MAAAHQSGAFVRCRFKRIRCVRWIKVKYLKQILLTCWSSNTNLCPALTPACTELLILMLWLLGTCNKRNVPEEIMTCINSQKDMWRGTFLSYS